jgi:hypothetical protein
MNYISLIAVSCAFFLCISGVSGLSLSGEGSWSYSQNIAITDYSGVDLKDYEVLIELDHKNINFSRTNLGGSDIRFVYGEDQELAYWIEEWDDEEKKARIWINIPELSKKGKVTVRMLYGNEHAISSSNGTATFIFFDDFSLPSVDEQKWNIEGAIGTWSIDEGRLKGYCYRSECNSHLTTLKPIMKDLSSWVVEWDGEASTGGQIRIDTRIDANGDWRKGYLTYVDLIRKQPAIITRSVMWFGPYFPYQADTPYFLQQIYDGSFVRLKVYSAVADPMPPGYYYLSASASAQIAWYDNLRIRHYASIEPRVAVSEDVTYLNPEPPSIPGMGISLVKSASPSSVPVNGEVAVILALSNTGTTDIMNYTVKDTFPPAFEIIEGTTEYSAASLGPGETITFEYVLRAQNLGVHILGNASAVFTDIEDRVCTISSNAPIVEVVPATPETTVAPPASPTTTSGLPGFTAMAAVSGCALGAFFLRKIK